MRGRILLAAAIGLATACGRADAQGPAEGPPPALTDPLRDFSHRVHVADNAIGCGVCHPTARHSPVAGLASMATCMGCHKFVAKGRPDVQRLARAFEAGQAIQWPRIHRLPDHVFFSHERHVTRGVACAECHGEMATRTLAVQQQPINMGFCLDCHLARGASTDCLACHK